MDRGPQTHRLPPEASKTVKPLCFSSWTITQSLCAGPAQTTLWNTHFSVVTLLFWTLLMPSTSCCPVHLGIRASQWIRAGHRLARAALSAKRPPAQRQLCTKITSAASCTGQLTATKEGGSGSPSCAAGQPRPHAGSSGRAARRWRWRAAADGAGAGAREAGSALAPAPPRRRPAPECGSRSRSWSRSPEPRTESPSRASRPRHHGGAGPR